MVLGRVRDPDRGLIVSHLNAEGKYADKFGVPGLLPPTRRAFDRDEYAMHVADDIGGFIEERWRQIPEVLYRASGLSPEAVDLYIPHQVTRSLIEAGRHAARLSPSLVIDILADYGNCGSVGLLIALDHAFREKRLAPGTSAMLSAVGGGIAWGGLLLRA